MFPFGDIRQIQRTVKLAYFGENITWVGIVILVDVSFALLPVKIDQTPIDLTAPIVHVQSFEETIYTNTVNLTFIVSEPTSSICYSLDGQDNLTISGNTTLTGLPKGHHNVTVYAWDAAGNVGASETVTFTVTEPESFSTVPLAAVSAVSIAAVTAGLLLYNRKRRREAQQT